MRPRAWIFLGLLLCTGAGPSPAKEASQALFTLGLGDPRDGEYREIEVAVGSPWDGGGHLTRTHGWVLPAPIGERPRAICWNGLVYVPASVGARANLRADVKVAITAELRAPIWRADAFEGSLVSHERLHPLWVPLLFRLGEDRLAQAAWTTVLAALKTMPKSPLRRGDLVAWLLSRKPGFPAFDFAASEAERDRTLEAVRVLLRR